MVCRERGIGGQSLAQVPRPQGQQRRQGIDQLLPPALKGRQSRQCGQVLGFGLLEIKLGLLSRLEHLAGYFIASPLLLGILVQDIDTLLDDAVAPVGVGNGGRQ